MQSNERQQHQGRVLRVLQSKDETRAFYDKISAVYDLLAEPSEGPVRQSGIDRLALASRERVLEIGYGTGHCLVVSPALLQARLPGYGNNSASPTSRTDSVMPTYH